MTGRFADNQEVREWDRLVLANPDGGNVFQSAEFAGIKKHQGWRAVYAVTRDVHLTILEKPVPGLGKLWYVPKGPGVASVAGLERLLPELRELAGKNGVFAVKLEPELEKTDETLVSLLKLGLQKVRPIQPNFSTILIDLSPTLSEIMASLNQKGRHAIRRAERDGVTVEQVPSSDENCRQMYGLLAETAAGSFGIRAYEYYRQFWQEFERAGIGQLFFARYEGQVVAGAYTLIFGTKSTYKDGASTRRRTAYGASHLLQWHVARWAKQHGSQAHDLCGAPPSDQINNPEHPHYGIGRFKTSFNKNVTDYIGAYDMVIRPKRYKLWITLVEKILLRWYHKRHKESYY